MTKKPARDNDMLRSDSRSHVTESELIGLAVDIEVPGFECRFFVVEKRRHSANVSQIQPMVA